MNPPYTHLSLDERRELFQLRSAQIPMRVIAQRLSRHPSTPYREIKRNWFQDEEPLYRDYFHTPRLSGCSGICPWPATAAEPGTPASREASPSHLVTPSNCVRRRSRPVRASGIGKAI